MKYLFITEDGTCYQGDNLTDDDKAACDDGILTIIDVETAKEYFGGAWTDVPSWEVE